MKSSARAPLGLAVLGLSVGALIGLAAPPPPAGPGDPVASVTVVRPRAGSLARRLTLPGTVRAYQEATLYSKVGGYLKAIHVDRGDLVLRGQLLAEVEVPELLAERERATAEFEAAEIERKRLREARDKAPDLVTPQALDAAEGHSAVARANLKRIETLLGYARLTAPFSGVVTRRWVDPGAFVPAATSSSAAKTSGVVTVMDLMRVRIEVAVPESEVPFVRKGLPVDVSVAEWPGRTFTGSVTRIAYALDEATRTMATEIDIPNPDRALRPGMYVRVQLAMERRGEGLLLPAEALVTDKEGSYVFTAREGLAHKVPVKTGLDDGITIEVLQGLSHQSLVVVSGKHALVDGQAVRAVEAR
jgi:membrane fusion protein (multidrug efflux system)